MKKLTALLAAALVAGSVAVPATPVAAQSFSLSFGDRGHWDRWDRPRWSPRWHAPRHRRGGVEINIGPFSFKARLGHVERCKARYRSYDPATDRFKTYGGEWKRCRL